MAESDQELARDLGFLEAYTLGLGTMIGAGIFVLPGIVAESAGPASMVSFVERGHGTVGMARGEQRAVWAFRQALIQCLEG